MPIYATIADVQAAIGADRLLTIADHDGDRVLDTSVVEQALAEASSEADMLIRFEVVPTPVPVAIRRAIVDIAVHTLREARDASTEASIRAHDEAIKLLSRIGEGKAALAPNDTVSSVEAGDPMFDGGERTWTRDTARRVF